MWITQNSDKYGQGYDLLLPLPIPPRSYRAQQPSPHQLHKQCSGNIPWHCEYQYKDLHPHLRTQRGSTASRTPDLELMLLKNMCYLLWPQAGFLQLHCKQHLAGTLMDAALDLMNQRGTITTIKGQNQKQVLWTSSTRARLFYKRCSSWFPE